MASAEPMALLPGTARRAKAQCTQQFAAQGVESQTKLAGPFADRSQLSPQAIAFKGLGAKL